VDLNIGMSAYMLAVAVFIPISGWLADRLGSRLVFSAAIADERRFNPCSACSSS